jgi:hypothetical protein
MERMKPETLTAIQRAKAYVHYKRLEKDQSEDNQAMANDLALILEALERFETALRTLAQTEPVAREALK